MATEQEQFWQGEFGEQYRIRNTMNEETLDEVYEKQYGVSRTTMNQAFLPSVNIDSILEVGCNTGNQLLILQQMGYTNLHGIELSPSAVEVAKRRLPSAEIRQGSAFSLPYEDNAFDVVFTSGVLIHLAPQDLEKAMREIIRVSKCYIWGFEYYDEQLQEIPYRENTNKMWRGPYARIYQSFFPQALLLETRLYPYINHSANVDAMFLLKK